MAAMIHAGLDNSCLCAPGRLATGVVGLCLVVLGALPVAGCSESQRAGIKGKWTDLTAPGPADNAPLATPADTPVRVEPWVRKGSGPGSRLTTDHYTIFTTLGAGPMRQRLGGFLEAARANYVHLTGLEDAGTPDQRLVVYLLASREQWVALTEHITGPASETYLKVQRGGYCYAGTCVLWDIGMAPTFSVAGHEGLHQFLHHAVRDTPPVWAEEGLAVLCEGFRVSDNGLVCFDPRRNVSRQMTLRQTILQDRWRPIDRLIAMSAAENVEDSALHGADYYGQLWALMLLIRQDQRYADGLRHMMRDAATGRLGQELHLDPQAWSRLRHNAAAYTAVVGPKAFAHYIDPDLTGFETRYRAFAEELARLP